MSKAIACALLLGCLLMQWRPAWGQDVLGDQNSEAADAAAADNAQMQGPSIPQLATRLSTGAPAIDGDLSDPFWQQLDDIAIEYELFPVRLRAAGVTTRVRIALTDTHFYAAFDAHDPDISALRSALRERDGLKSDDYVSLVLDPAGQGLRKYEFRVNPHGSQSDVLQDTVGDRYLYDWDTDWQAAAQITEQGYRVELAIPRQGAHLSPEDPDAPARLLVMLKRHYPRQIERTLGTAVELLLPDGAPLAELPAGSARRLTLTPHYVYDLDEDRDIGGSFAQVDEQQRHAAGVYLDYQISAERRLLMTVNPNYAEVESDIARDSINNPFDPYEPEKRELFVDAREYFRTLNEVVYTRNIVEPDIGAAHFWSTPTTTSGLLGAMDSQTRVYMPDNLGSDVVTLVDNSQSFAFNYERQSDKRSFGVLGTLRTAEDYHNAVLSFNGTGNLGVDDKVRGQLLVSDTRYPQRFAEDLCDSAGCTELPPAPDCELGDCATTPYVQRADFDDTLRGYNLQLRYNHDGPDSLYWARYYDVSPDFRADLGFIRRVDYRALNLAYGRKWYFQANKEDESQSRIRAYLIGGHMRSHSDNQPLKTTFGIWGEFRGSYQTIARVGWQHRKRAVNRIDQSDLSAGDNAPRFDEHYWQWFFQTSPFPAWTLHLDGRWGSVADPDNLVLGKMRELKPRLQYSTDRLDLMAELTQRHFETDGEQLYKESFASLTALYHADNGITHRLLWLRDLTKRDTDRWRGDELGRETSQTLEYTQIFSPYRHWQLMWGVRLVSDYESDIDERGLTERELYFKVQREITFFD